MGLIPWRTICINSYLLQILTYPTVSVNVVRLFLSVLCMAVLGQALTLKVAYIFKVFRVQSCLIVPQLFDRVIFACEEYVNFQDS